MIYKLAKTNTKALIAKMAEITGKLTKNAMIKQTKSPQTKAIPETPIKPRRNFMLLTYHS